MVHRISIALAAVLAFSVALAAGPMYRIPVSGLRCKVCADSLERQLKTLAGIEQVTVDLEADAVLITMKEGTTLNKAAADKVIESAGFHVKERSAQ